MRCWAFVAAIVALSLTAFAARAAGNSDVEVIRGPYLVADVETGRIITDFDALRPWFPASTTKLMSIYVTFEAIRAGEISLDDEIVYSSNAAAEPPSKMGFRPGSTFTLDNALKMMMVKSANDIAVAVAEGVGGSVEEFAARMNAAAEHLGMTRSHFVNPHGLPDTRQYTTVRDMAVLARALLTEFSEYRPYYGIHAIIIGDRVLRNYNRLLDRFPGATGMKTGFICSSGYNLVASAQRDGRELIAVVFGEYGGKLRNEHAAQLLTDAFETQVRVETETTLLNVQSGDSYDAPFDMRPSVCGPQRAAVLALLNSDEGDDDEAGSYLQYPIDNGPPIRVSAYVPAVYGEPGYVAPLPRPRPVLETDVAMQDGLAGDPAADIQDDPTWATRFPRPRPEAELQHLEAFAPVDGGAADSEPAEAIGAAAGDPLPLHQVAPE